MKRTIGVMGSSGGDFDDATLAAAYEVGRQIAKHDCVLVTGACPGLPLQAARGAKAEGGLVVGISPGLSADEHMYKYGSPLQYHDVTIYTGSGLMGREIANIRSSDIVIILGGRSGTLGEFAIAYDEGKLIGILQGSGGIADLAPQIVESLHKDTGAHIVYQADPAQLVEATLDMFDFTHHRRPSCFHRPPRTLVESWD
ncbi:MAG: hypothetical protein FJZ00_00350 [Candidatus Sericytochromatia bacterium]|uniref:Protein containing YHS domain protein n=1 Tax=Candidatus Tanganyikabacteria bacterium TaxID=2961651 RepID=A0A937X3L7_9BACT|nr:hypothetical protein [Candidatus Tanganyikabacteria bacterium]